MESIQELLRRLCKCIVKSDDGLNYITTSKQDAPEPGPGPDPTPGVVDPYPTPNGASEGYIDAINDENTPLAFRSMDIRQNRPFSVILKLYDGMATGFKAENVYQYAVLDTFDRVPNNDEWITIPSLKPQFEILISDSTRQRCFIRHYGYQSKQWSEYLNAQINIDFKGYKPTETKVIAEGNLAYMMQYASGDAASSLLPYEFANLLKTPLYDCNFYNNTTPFKCNLNNLPVGAFSNTFNGVLSMSYLPTCVLNADAIADYEWSNTFKGVVIKNLKTSDGKYNNFHVSYLNAGNGCFNGTFCDCTFLSKETFNIAQFPYPVDASSNFCADMFKNTIQTPDIVITAFNNNNANASNVASNAFSDFLLNASENGRLFIPWKLQSVIKCPDTWERYTI